MTDQPTDRDAGAPNRGVPARIDSNGAVSGSGAGVGGGAPEDFDADSAGGAEGDEEPRVRRQPGTGGDAPSHGSG